MDEQNTIELAEHRAVIELPEDSIEIQIFVKLYRDGMIVSATKTMSISEIRRAFQRADDGYIDEDDRFVITEKGLKWLEGCEANGTEIEPPRFDA